MIEIDISTDIRNAERRLYRWEREYIPRAMSSAINKTRNNMRTAANRYIAKRTGLKIKELKSAQFTINSSRYTLFATLTARRRPFTLRRFMTRQQITYAGGMGRNNRAGGIRAKPWRKLRTFEGAFLIRGRTHGKMIPVVRTNRAGTGLKVLYGPSVNNEFRKPRALAIMRRTVRERFPINFEKDLAYFISRAK